MICPLIPADPDHRMQLEEDLDAIGCLGLLERPWCMKNESLIQELIFGAPNQYLLTLRGRPVSWMEEVWAEVYGFKKSGEGFAGRTDKYVAGKFFNKADPKEGFANSDCIDGRHRRVLEFLIPIVYLEKPTRVTVTVANTIFGAFTDRPVWWGRIIHSLVAKLVENLAKPKPTPICPYVFHLYHHQEILNHKEMVEYNTGLDMVKFGLTEELEKMEKATEDEAGSEEDEEEPTPLEKRKRKSTDPSARGKAPSPERGEPSHAPEAAQPKDFFVAEYQWMDTAKRMYTDATTTLLAVSEELDVLPEEMIEAIRKRATPEVLQQKEEQIRKLVDEKATLLSRLEWTESEAVKAR